MRGLYVVLYQLVYRRVYVFLVIRPLVHLHGHLIRRPLSLYYWLIALIFSLELLNTDLRLIDLLFIPGLILLELTPLLTRIQNYSSIKYRRLIKSGVVFVQLLPAEINISTKVVLGSKILGV